MRLIYENFIYTFLIFIPNSITQTTPRVDSLLKKVEEETGSERLKIWNDWFLSAIEETIKDVKNIIDQDSVGNWINNTKSILVEKFRELGRVDLSIQLLDEMKIYADSLSKVKDSPHESLAKWYRTKGYFLYMQSDSENAEKFYIRAIEIYKFLDNTREVYFLYQRLGYLKSYTGDYEESLNYYDLAEELFDESSLSLFEKYRFYYGKAYLYEAMDKPELAHNYFLRLKDSMHVLYSAFSFRIQIDYAKNICNLGRIEEGIQLFKNLRPIIEEEEEIIMTKSKKPAATTKSKNGKPSTKPTKKKPKSNSSNNKKKILKVV